MAGKEEPHAKIKRYGFSNRTVSAGLNCIVGAYHDHKIG